MNEKIKILVSDDNQDFARTLVSYLSKDEDKADEFVLAPVLGARFVFSRRHLLLDDYVSTLRQLIQRRV